MICELCWIFCKPFLILSYLFATPVPPLNFKELSYSLFVKTRFDHTSWHTPNYAIWGYILCYNGISRYHSPIMDCYSSKYGASLPNPNIILNDNGPFSFMAEWNFLE